MDWLPHTIDSLTAMLREAGVIGSIAFVFCVTLSILLWKHLGDLLKLGDEFVKGRATADKDILIALENLNDTNQSIKISNEKISERVHKLPSDNVCKARTDEQVRAILREELRERGHTLTDGEWAMLEEFRKKSLAHIVTQESIKNGT